MLFTCIINLKSFYRTSEQIKLIIRLSQYIRTLGINPNPKKEKNNIYASDSLDFQARLCYYFDMNT